MQSPTIPPSTAAPARRNRMLIRPILLVSALLVSEISCSPTTFRSSIGSECAPRPGEVFGATADSMLGGVPVSASPGIVHTERMMMPDPLRRTQEHLHGMRFDLLEYARRHTGLPSSIEEFYDVSAPGIKYHIDGWGSSIRYTRLDAETYRFRAPGPDHVLCTGDDIIETGQLADLIG